MSESSLPEGPAFYAQPSFLTRPRWREWWTVLHPPYTMLHLALVTVGACLTGPVNTVHWIATLLAFFLAVGIAAHALDELNGRPLSTTIPARQLIAAAIVGLGGAVALGIAGLFLVNGYLAIFIVIGLLAAVGYNLELFGGRLHTSLVFALSWGAFPILTAYFAQHGTLSLASFVAASFGALVVKVQQVLSTPARDLRRRVASIEGSYLRVDGSRDPITKESLLRPYERALKALCSMGVALAVALALNQYIH